MSRWDSLPTSRGPTTSSSSSSSSSFSTTTSSRSNSNRYSSSSSSSQRQRRQQQHIQHNQHNDNESRSRSQNQNQNYSSQNNRLLTRSTDHHHYHQTSTTKQKKNSNSVIHHDVFFERRQQQHNNSLLHDSRNNDDVTTTAATTLNDDKSLDFLKQKFSTKNNNNNNTCLLFFNDSDDDDYNMIVSSLEQIQKDISIFNYSPSSGDGSTTTNTNTTISTKKRLVDIFTVCVDIVNKMIINQMDDIVIENLLVSILDSILVGGKTAAYHKDEDDSSDDDNQRITHQTTLLPIPESQIQNAVTVLSQKCHTYQKQRTTTTTTAQVLLFVGPLTYLIRYYFHLLGSAESTAIIVGNIFVPILNIMSSSIPSCSSSPSPPSNNKQAKVLLMGHKVNILNTLTVLLRDSRQASALLGSLVRDVTIDGSEETIVNPLKFRLITVLQQTILIPNNTNNNANTNTNSDNHQQQQQMEEEEKEELGIRALSCTVLSQITDAMKGTTTVPETTTIANSGLDLRGLGHFISSTINDEGPQKKLVFLKKQCLVLFRSLLRFQPSAISGLVSKLIMIPLWDGSDTSKCCQRCNTKESDLSGFVQLVHLCESSKTKGQYHVIDKDTSCLAVISLTECIKSMPWDRWLGLHNTMTTSSCSPPCSISHRNSGFGRRLVDSLVVILNVIRCNIISLDDGGGDFDHGDALAEAISQLAKSALLNLPFSKDRRLNTTTVNLIVALSDIVFKRQHMSSSNSKTKKAAAFDVLVYSMGGWETPNGNTVPMCAPTRTWLSNPQLSQSVLRSSFQSAKANDDNTDVSIRFISAILRTRPETASEMQAEILELVQDTKQRFQVLRVLAALMVGRKSAATMQDDGSSGDGHDGNLVSDLIVSSVISFLRNSSKGDDCNAKYQCLRFDTYAALLPNDWVSLASLSNNGGNDFSVHFHSIIMHCKEANAKVRISATKALAGFCSFFSTSQCILLETDDSLAQTAAHSVCETMLKNMNDNNAGVRAISHFCIGDLGYSIHKTDHDNLIDENTLLRVCSKVQEALTDQNDKVAGNSIRSIGYWGYVLSRNTSLDRENHERTKILQLILESLNAKLTRALSLTSNEDRQIMTWKQRSVAKKHGWGAANAISLLFQYADLDHTLFKSYFDVLCLLMVCVEKFLELSEKIAFSAIMAIRSLSPPQLSKLTRGSGVVGNGIVACLLRIYQAKEMRSAASTIEKVVGEYQLLLRHLLDSATVLDASTVLRNDEMSHSLRQYLYHWMVTNDSDGRSFQVFALAFQRPGLKETDVLLEQNFASRARQRDNKSNPNPISGSSEDDDADEL